MVFRHLLVVSLIALVAPAVRLSADESPYGINGHAPQGSTLPAVFDAAQAAGIRWVRIDFRWSSIQPAFGVYDFGAYDAIVAAAAARGLSLYATIQSTPAWATDGPPESGVPRNASDFTTFCTAAARRYSGTIAAWGIWNEPNLAAFWAGTRQQYLDVLLKPGADAIHAASPGVLVGGPDLAHLQGNGAVWYRWLQDVIGQAGPRLDVVTHHVYGTDAAAVTAKLDASTTFGGNPGYWDFVQPSLREVLVEAGWQGPVWLTEVGWASDQVGETAQATHYTQLLNDWLTVQQGRAWLKRVFFYELIDDARPGIPQYGILRADRTQKPAYQAYRAFIAANPAAAPPKRIVPIVLDSRGKTNAQFTSQLALANPGPKPAQLSLTYTAATSLGASGSGTVTETLAAGRQLLLPDALEYLREKGLAIPKATPARSQGGTLRVTFGGLTVQDVSYAGARTTAASGSGRAGLAYGAPRLEETFLAPVHVFGLRETGADRSNLALLNPGETGSVTLRVTLFAGDGSGRSVALSPDSVLPAGQWAQLNAVLSQAGMTNGWARVERVAGDGRFLAYGVFNDNVTSDGSYVPALPAGRAASVQVVPALVETPAFQTELVLTNATAGTLTAQLSYVESLAPFGGGGAAVTETLPPFTQRIVPRALDYLRGRGAAVGPAGGSYAGALTITFNAPGGFAGARTSSLAPTGGAYGVFYPAVSPSEAASTEAYVFGLLQDSASRSNLAFVNLGSAPVTLRYEVYSGATGMAVAASQPFELTPGGWRQVSGVLQPSGVSQGYVRVLRSSGTGPFLIYGIVNDGATPGSGTGDGSYVPMSGVR